MRLAAGGAQTGANIASATSPSGSAAPPPKRKASRALARKPRARKPKRGALALVVAAGAGSAGHVRSKERRCDFHFPPSHHLWLWPDPQKPLQTTSALRQPLGQGALMRPSSACAATCFRGRPSSCAGRPAPVHWRQGCCARDRMLYIP